MSGMGNEGFGTGMMIGGMIGLGAVAKSAIDAGAQHARASATVQRWSIALDRANLRATKVERQLARTIIDNRALRKALQDAQAELSILRNS